MSKRMSKRQWAAIVYGRSYHLDFRFITIPHDFTSPNITWAAQHILATTHQARNLAFNTRWSLFKNDSYCVVGITCMVRDLIGKLGEDLIEVMAKDDQGRPLYVFVGYVTQLNQGKSLLDFPAYTGEHLAGFKSLYQQVEKVWLIKDYDKNSKQPLLSQYQSLDFSVDIASSTPSIDDISQLNHQTKHPDKIFLWSSSLKQNNKLWISSAKCLESTSICLNIKGTSLLNSPFLNQTVTQLDQFKIQDRVTTSGQSSSDSGQSPPKDLSPSKSPQDQNSQVTSSLSQKISARAKEDLDLTLQNAAKMATASQELIHNFTDQPPSDSTQTPTQESSSQSNEEENFGFKTKKYPPPSSKQDWF